MKITPKNWAEFQHYKDRSPTWIKLHKNLIDDSKFQRLPVASRALAPMLWLLASECEGGTFEADHCELAFRLRQTEKEIREALDPLISKGFFVVAQPDITVLAEDYQEDSLEKRREEIEIEIEKRREDIPPRKSAANKFLKPMDVDERVWGDFENLRKQKKSPITETAITGIRREAMSAGVSLQEALQMCCERGWQGFRAAWIKPDEKTKTANKQQALEDRNDTVLAEFLAERQAVNAA